MRWSDLSFFLMKNMGAPIGDLDGWMQPFVRFSQRKLSSSFCSAGELSPRCKVNGMVPCLPWWEFVKGFIGEDISEVAVLDWHHILKGLAFLSLLGFLG